jgi:NAD(P)-dependent dehydrogenase (short-subunit alcohol dehydrogenase family)
MELSKNKNKSVLVTGASRGLGRDIAINLNKRGFRVFAGVRKTNDATSIKEESNQEIIPLLLDITDAQAVNAAYNEIATATGESGLAGLVNNAGIAVFGPVETVSLSDIEDVFRVNFFSIIILIQKFLPLLRKSHGRIVNISSINGRLSMPATGIYSASKYALEGMSHALRLELKKWGINVSIVEPGAMATDIRMKAIEAWKKRREGLTPEKKALYTEFFQKTEALIKAMETGALDLNYVSDSVFDALTADDPKELYMSDPNQKQWEDMIAMSNKYRDTILLKMWG